MYGRGEIVVHFLHIGMGLKRSTILAYCVVSESGRPSLAFPLLLLQPLVA